jgi:hypothetical protein
MCTVGSEIWAKWPSFRIATCRGLQLRRGGSPSMVWSVGDAEASWRDVEVPSKRRHTRKETR